MEKASEGKEVEIKNKKMTSKIMILTKDKLMIKNQVKLKKTVMLC